MRVIILDPGYDHPHSHHRTVNEVLVEGIERDWPRASPVILTASALEASARTAGALIDEVTVPYFDTPVYPPNVEHLAVDEHLRLARKFAGELIKACDDGYLTHPCCLVMHTAHAHQVLGLAQALQILPENTVTGVYLSMMFDPGVIGGGRAGGQLSDIFAIGRYVKYRLAFRLLSAAAGKHGAHAILETSCEQYRNAYQRVANDYKVGVHPIVTFGRNWKVDNRAREGTVLLHLGAPKAEKGFRYSLAVADELSRVRPDLRVVVHFNDQFPGAPSYNSAVEELETGKPSLEVIRGHLDPEKYNALLAEATVMCVLYDPEHYGFKTSGVLWDGLRRDGVSFVVTGRTWAADELNRLGIDFNICEFGDVRGAVDAIIDATERAPQDDKTTQRNRSYLDLVRADFGAHAIEHLCALHDNAQTGSKGKTTVTRSQTKRILIVRTGYDHFGNLSGPSGFIPPLRDGGLHIDEMCVELGNGDVPDKLDRVIANGGSDPRGSLASYQLNSVSVERQLLCENWHDYDVIHFLDAEHTGVITALAINQFAADAQNRPRLVATFHQPCSILSDIVKDSAFLNGFDLVHVLSPCQKEFFSSNTNTPVKVIPHGIAPELLDLYQAVGEKSFKQQGVNGLGGGQKAIVLTVGNWLRDFEILIETARAFETDTAIEFKVVSKSLDLHGELPSNVKLINHGVSDNELHAMYKDASALFLPLKDGAANNAVLESMVHGLPIVTRDLPAARYYTDDTAFLCRHDAMDYACTIRKVLESYDSINRSALQTRAEALRWTAVAEDMKNELYDIGSIMRPLECRRAS